MLTPSTTEPLPAETTGARECLLDGTFVDPAELSELVGIFRAVLPDSTDDEALRGLDSEVVQGTGCRNGACSICCAVGCCKLRPNGSKGFSIFHSMHLQRMR